MSDEGVGTYDPGLEDSPVAVAPVARGRDWGWTILLAGIALMPFMLDSVTWAGVSHRLFYSPATFAQAMTAQAFVAVSLAIWAWGLFSGARSVRWHKALWVPAAYVLWACVSTAVSVSRGTAVIGAYTRSEGLLALLTMATAGFLVVQYADGAKRIEALLATISSACAVVSAYGVAQSLGFDPIPWGMVAWGSHRSFATMGNPDMFGALCVLGLGVSLGLALASRHGRGAHIWWWVASTLCAAGALTSLSRAAWIGGVIVAVVVVALSLKVRVELRRIDVIAIVGMLVVLCALGAVSATASSADDNVVQRAASTLQGGSRNTTGRVEIWRMALSSVAARPITGYGLDTFAVGTEPHRTEAMARIVSPTVIQDSAHDFVLQSAVETGVPGVVLWLGSLVVGAALGWRVIAGSRGSAKGPRLVYAGAWAGCAGFLGASLFTPSHAVSSLYLWCLLAVMIAPWCALRPAMARSATVGVSVAVTVVAAVALTGVGVLASADHRAAIATDEARNTLERQLAADAAMRLDPLSAEYAAVAARVYGARAVTLMGEQSTPEAVRAAFNQAVAAAKRSVHIEPTNPRRLTVLASLLYLGADRVDPALRSQGLAASARATRLSPNDMEAAYWYARGLAYGDQRVRAAKILKRVLSLRPDYVEASVLLSDIYVADGDVAAAKRVLEQAADTVDDARLTSALEALPASR